MVRLPGVGINPSKLFGALIIFILVSSCSTVSIPNPLGSLKSSTSILTVETPECSRATCRVKNDAGIFFLTTPNTITITKSKSPLEITCYVEELLPDDILSPETIKAEPNQSYVNHPFACPLTETELYVKDQLEQNYQESILEEEADVTPVIVETPAEELEPQEPILTDAQITGLAQLDKLLAKKMISQETYDQEKTILLNEED